VKRRVVITGVGLVTAVGVGTRETWSCLVKGKSGVGPITRFDTSDFPARIAAEVKSFDPAVFVEKKDVKKMDTFIHYAMAAAEFAMKDSELKIEGSEGEKVGVIIGSGIGGFGTIEREHEVLLKEGPRRISPFFIPSSIVNLAAGQVSIRYGARGPNSAPCTACSAGTHAVGDSFKIIQRSDADVMIAGGSEAAITPMGVGGFAALKALSTRNEEPTKASRPFDRERDGFVVGEGAGVLILEELEHALRRGASIHAEIVGYGMSGDAYHITAHGTSTPPNDRIETMAIRSVFGEHASKLAISSTKSMIGHLLGAAGAVEAGVTALTIRDQIIHPTINQEVPDPECDLDYVPNVARRAAIRYALSNSFGFGGTNASILLKRFEE